MLLILREILHNLDTFVTIEYPKLQYKLLFSALETWPVFPERNSGTGGVRFQVAFVE